MSEHCVIIGNGPAGNEAALTLRNKVPNLRITMISKEPTRYYQPNLLPDYIAGKVGADDVYVNPLGFYSENDIKLRLGQPVTSLDLERRQLSLDHKEVVRFDSLIIAAGGKPRIPEPVQVFSELMMTLKTFEDADKWMDLLKTAESVLVVGGDLTSLVFTNALLELGKRVYFILNEDSFWPVRYNDEIHAQVSKRLFDRGVEVIACQNLRRISRVFNDLLQVETDNKTLEVGAVGAFYGLTPDVKFLAGSGLLIERGVLVNEFLNTGIEGIYAAGDCAQVYHPGVRDYWVSVGFRNAKNLGRIAALNLLGGKYEAEVVPQNIFLITDIVINTSWWTEF